MEMEIDKLKIYYNIVGKGSNILILHGWGVSMVPYEPVVKELSKNHKIYILDMPGFGNSEEPDKPWDVDDYTNFIIKFININNINDLSIIAHSFGGRIAIKMCSKERDFTINKLVLMDSAGIKPKHNLYVTLKIKLYKLGKKIIFNKYILKVFPRSLNNIKNKLGSQDYRNATPIMKETLVKTVIEDLKYLLKDIKIPTLLVWGTHDMETPYDDALVMEKEIPNAGIVKIEGAGHFSFLDNTSLVNKVLNNFFEEENK
ncbi:MAG: alpha/beta hydrolase [Bacilli bacterium]